MATLTLTRCYCDSSQVLGEPIVLNKSEMLIGRHPIEYGVDIHLPDTSVAKRHARITQLQGCYRIEDLASRNGIYVNQQRLIPFTCVILSDGDEITIGGYVLVFHSSEHDGGNRGPEIHEALATGTGSESHGLSD